jgi:hypothetical protein
MLINKSWLAKFDRVAVINISSAAESRQAASTLFSISQFVEGSRSLFFEDAPFDQSYDSQAVPREIAAIPLS